MFNKISGYQRKLVYEWEQLHYRREIKAQDNKFDAWLKFLAKKPFDVLLGANFATYGGVRHHMHAIQQYSSLSIELAPSSNLLKKVSPHAVTHTYRDKFHEFPAKGIKVIHSHVYPWFIEWCKKKHETGIPWIHTYHLNYYPEHSLDNLQTWQKEINEALINVAPQADRCLSVSLWQQAELEREYGIKTEYLPNAVDIRMCDQAKPQRFIRKYNYDNFILYVGRNDSVKNPVDFVHLACSMPEHNFIMIGRKLSSESLKTDWGIDIPNNLFVIGSLSQTEVQDAIAACSVLVVTSKREGLPTLVMEAMAHAKPIVVPDDDGCMEVIGNGEVGYIYKQGDIDDLLKRTLQALEDSSIGQRARQRVLSEYDWRVIAPKLDAIYRSVMS